MPVLVASRLTRRFDERIAVDAISFTLQPGEVFGLLGPNGAGKTTTLRMLAGLIAPSEGTITLDGTPMPATDGATLRRRIGFLTEAPGLWDRLTVRQNLTVYARLYGLAHPSRAVDEAMELFGIRGRAHDLAAQLSKGLRQRVALARTLLHHPEIVLLDEPTSGLDPESARDVRDLILEQRKAGRAVLVSTHNLAEIERIADRVAILRTRMIAVDTPTALRAQLYGSRLRIALGQPASAFVAAAGGPGVADVSADHHVLSIAADDARGRAPAIIRRLVAAGADIESVVPEQVSLEEVYLRLMQEEPA
jgi:ABC-2 type transport system ATP-binding protein